MQLSVEPSEEVGQGGGTVRWTVDQPGATLIKLTLTSNTPIALRELARVRLALDGTTSSSKLKLFVPNRGEHHERQSNSSSLDHRHNSGGGGEASWFMPTRTEEYVLLRVLAVLKSGTIKVEKER